jgi:hypothetical protein
MFHRFLTIVLSVLVMSSFLAPVEALAKPLSDAEQARIAELITEAKKARVKGDLERVADLLKEAIGIKADPSLRWNLARVYEGLCAYRGAADQFDALAVDKTVAKDIREQAQLRRTGLERYLQSPHYRVRLKTKGALLYIEGTEVSTEEDSGRPFSNSRSLVGNQSEYHVEIHRPDGYGTRIRDVRASLERCVTIDDDLDATAQVLGSVRFKASKAIATLELNSLTMRRLRVRANIATLRELELPAGDYRIEARCTDGDLLEGEFTVESGGVVSVMLKDIKVLSDLAQPNAGTTEGMNSQVAVSGTAGSQKSTDLWAWVSAGAGVVLLGSGAFILGQLQTDASNYDKTLEGGQFFDQATAVSRYDELRDQQTLAWTLAGLGLVGSAISVWLFTMDSGRVGQGHIDVKDSGVSVMPGMDGSLHLKMRF